MTILTVGKLRDAGLRKLCDDYYRRCRGKFKVREVEVRDRARLQAAVGKHRGPVIMLDERGEGVDSQAFAGKLRKWVQGRAGGVAFIIGGADGLGAELRGQATALLSLGELTFAHQLVRVIFAEQLYRAVSIWEGAPYHRGG